jgi:hypothetical protein
MLAAKVAGAVHNWPALLPQIRMEYMQREQSTTGYSPNRLVFCTMPRQPPPLGALRWDARAASVVAAASTSAGMGGRDFRTSRFLLITHDLSPFFPHHV